MENNRLNQTAADRRTARQERRYERLSGKNDTARICRVGFPMLAVCLLITAAAEIKAYISYQRGLYGETLLIRNLSVSLAACFAVAAPFLITAATLQIKRGFDSDYFKKLRDRWPGRDYDFGRRFLFVALFTGIGLALCLVMAIIFR